MPSHPHHPGRDVDPPAPRSSTASSVTTASTASTTRRRTSPSAIALAVVGLVLLGIPAWALLTRFGAIVTGHPVYPAMLGLSALVGAGLLVRAVSRLHRPTGDVDGEGRQSSRAGSPGRAVLRVGGGLVAVILTVIVAVVLIFGRPHGATDVAVEAMKGTGTVSVTHDTTSITLTPRENTGVGVVFQPGARVDARAYVPILTRIAEQGHTVVIAEQPFGVSLLAQGAASRAMDAHPEVSRWVVAGHSLGGVAAARTAASGDPRVVGLVFWASYADVSTPTDVVPVLSVYGTNDGLIPVAEAVPDPADRPANTRYVPAEGANHTSFADYGTQSGDGVESVAHVVAQERIVEPTLAFLKGPAG